MEKIIDKIADIAIFISEELKYAGFEYTNNQNASGDNQLKLDVKCDEIITQELSKVLDIKSLISEEKEEELLLNKDGKYIVAYDPLDGSSVVDVNFTVGSIFGIYENKVSSSTLKASLYIIYGPILELVICKDIPKLYRLDKNLKFQFIKDLKLNEYGKINATGGTQKEWSKAHKEVMSDLFEKGYRLRYSGAMVADLHHILLKGGGLFSYPPTKDAPNGKLRIVFEVLPFAFIYERAGGFTTDGYSNSLFELEIKKNHQTTPCFFGSKNEIKILKDIYLDARK